MVSRPYQHWSEANPLLSSQNTPFLKLPDFIDLSERHAEEAKLRGEMDSVRDAATGGLQMIQVLESHAASLTAAVEERSQHENELQEEIRSMSEAHAKHIAESAQAREDLARSLEVEKKQARHSTDLTHFGAAV